MHHRHSRQLFATHRQSINRLYIYIAYSKYLTLSMPPVPPGPLSRVAFSGYALALVRAVKYIPIHILSRRII